MRLRLGVCTLLLVGVACSGQSSGSGAAPDGRDGSVRAFAGGNGQSGPGSADVGARVETDPYPNDADDPAVWIHPEDPGLSIVIGTDKNEGLGVHDLSGKALQWVRDGDFNNVDLRAVELDGTWQSLVVAADDSRSQLRVYRVDVAARRLVEVAGSPIATGVRAHGLCLYRSPVNGVLYAFPNSPDGRTEQWAITGAGGGAIASRRVRGPWKVGGEIEGCVADEAHRLLFIGEEEVGIWRYGAEPGDSIEDRVQVDRTGVGGNLTADVEGLSILDTGGGNGFLVASSQGNNSFTIYERRPGHRFVDRFRITAASADGCEDSDGIEIVNRPLGSAFPDGLFVCQDGHNDGGGTNFKFAPLGPIRELAQR